MEFYQTRFGNWNSKIEVVNFNCIKQSDIDGKYIYSDIRQINFINPEQIISITPNPAKNYIQLRISSARRMTGRMSTINV